MLRLPDCPAHAVRKPALPEPLQAVLDSSPSLAPVLEQAHRYAHQRLPLLLEGETGTGKDLLALAIHRAGPAPGGPFVAVNCAAIPRDLIASELFGHAEGAFTGARRGGTKGRFEQAHGGTLFLDEVGDMPLDLQLYLLRVVEERAPRFCGDERMRSVKTVTALSPRQRLRLRRVEGLGVDLEIGELFLRDHHGFGNARHLAQARGERLASAPSPMRTSRVVR